MVFGLLKICVCGGDNNIYFVVVFFVFNLEVEMCILDFNEEEVIKWENILDKKRGMVLIINEEFGIKRDVKVKFRLVISNLKEVINVSDFIIFIMLVLDYEKYF